jgi:branched-chain amino acid transport system permease protein
MTTFERALPEFRVRRSTRTSTVGAFAALPILALLGAGPYLFGRSGADQLVQLFILIIIGTMWNLLAGYAGMVSIGQQAYMGIGAYGLFAAVNLWGVNPFIALGVGVVIAAILSYPISFLVFRLTGGYFAIATWVVAEVIRQIVGRIPALSQGGVGTMTMDADRIASGPGSRSAYIYWAALIGVVVVIAVTYLMMRSRLGSGFRAIRDEPVAAASLGVSVMRGKRIAYVVAAAGCALGGALLALSLGQVRPDSMFRVDFSTWMIFIVVIGGLGTIEGPIIGAIVFFLLQNWLGGVGSWYLVILGVIAIVITLLLPRGLWGIFADRGIRLFPIGSRLDLTQGPAASKRRKSIGSDPAA